MKKERKKKERAHPWSDKGYPCTQMCFNEPTTIIP